MGYNIIPFHGSKARIEKNNVAVEFSADWNINVTVDVSAVPRQGKSWKEKVAGMADWKGSATLYFVPGNTEQKALIDNILAAAPGAILTDIKWLLDVAANAFTGDIMLVGMAITAPVGDKVGCTFSFEGADVDGLVITDAA